MCRAALAIQPGDDRGTRSMRAARLSTARLVLLVLIAIAPAAGAAPKLYSFTGKLTSNRGPLINIPLVGNTPCSGAGLADLTVMQGPGGGVVPAPTTPPTRSEGQPANFSIGVDCVGHGNGRLAQTTGAGVGGAFVLPTMIFSRPFQSYAAAVGVHMTPIVQLATSFKITGPRQLLPSTPPRGSMGYNFPSAAWLAFKKGAWMTQTGRQGSMFTWCWGNPDCAKITQGTRALIVKYSGGGNAFGGTMAYVISANPGTSSIAFAAGAGAVGFGLLSGMGSQPTGRGYASYQTDRVAPGPLWAAYMSHTVTRPRVGRQKLITMVTGHLGDVFPGGDNYNVGFPWTTMTVLARNTGTVIGNPHISTLTAKGGDTVTAGGDRNISLVTGGVARAVLAAGTSNTPEIGQLYLHLPEPGRAAQVFAGALGLLAIAFHRARRLGRNLLQ
jgi:hypothetical protein